MYGITRVDYAIDDNVQPILDLRPQVEARIDIEEARGKLFIGSRDYEWPRGCPDVCSLYSPRNGPQICDL